MPFHYLFLAYTFTITSTYVTLPQKEGSISEIKNKKEKLVDRKITIAFECKIVTDYEEKWESRPIWKVIRSVSDKYFNAKRKDSVEKELKEDTHDLFNKVKTFLNLYKFS